VAKKKSLYRAYREEQRLGAMACLNWALCGRTTKALQFPPDQSYALRRTPMAISPWVREQNAAQLPPFRLLNKGRRAIKYMTII
jgi:hypothetical protein